MAYKINKIHDWLYSIYDPMGVFCYLAIGENEALLFDTGHGVYDLNEAVKFITDKPYTVVLGHGHIDHANGAFQFDEVFLHENDFDLFKEHTSIDFRNMIIDRITQDNLTPPENFNAELFRTPKAKKIIKLEIGRTFNLGGLMAEVIGTAGHTAGSVSLLFREKKTLLVSDAANNHIWMFLEESLTVKEYIEMLERIYKLDFDVFLTGHTGELQDKSVLLEFMKVAQEASFEKAKPYSMFEDLKPYIYQDGNYAIVFNARTLGKE